MALLRMLSNTLGYLLREVWFWIAAPDSSWAGAIYLFSLLYVGAEWYCMACAGHRGVHPQSLGVHEI